MGALRDLVDELLHAKVKAKLFGGDHAPQLGRLRLLDRLGAGAMGTVFAAYDPRLDRRVAVKVLRTNDGAARVLAEARALAKLAHPNVVAVYDADELDGLVYIVMELAPGVPLRAWIAAPRDWREVVRVLREAGAGLAAAHAAGLVHRDIKPDNILVGDDRARVVDFGLANEQGAGDGASAGTPFYMAPEVLAGAHATAASDQFSFGVSMYEALYGKRPYDLAVAGSADTVPADAYARGHAELLDELRTAAGHAADAPRPSTSGAPAWLHAIVVRTLAAAPAHRFGSMTEVVAALGRDRRRTRLIALASGALVLGGVGGALAFRGGADPCTGGPARVAAVWNADARARVQAALAGTAWSAQTLGALEDHVTAWQASYRHVCEATRVHGDQSDALLDLRMHCLERGLARFDTLRSSFAPGLDAAALAAAPGAIGELPEPIRCETMTAAAELALPADKAARTRATAIEHDVDRAWASFVLGRYEDARSIVAAAQRDLATIEAPRLRATLLALSASIEARIGPPATASEQLDAALLAAAEAGAPELEYDVWMRRLRNDLFAGRSEKVLELDTIARAAAKRAGHEGAELDGILGEALRNTGKLDAARTLLTRALASSDPLRPGQRSVIEMNLGSVELASGDSTAALVTFGRARDRVLAALGDKHPDLALYADKLAAANRARGKLRDALRWHDASLALRLAAFGPDDRSIATSLLYRAQTRLEGGDVDAARTDAERALEIRTKVYGNNPQRLAEPVALLGDIAAARGDATAATAHYNRAAELDPALELIARRFELARRLATPASVAELTGADALVLGMSPAQIIGESPSVDRVTALVVRVELLRRAGHPLEATDLAAALRARFDATKDPALGYALGDAQLAAGDRDAAATIFTALVPTLGNEPTRTALRIFVGLAHASEAAAAARAAISLYQAMPRLERSPVYDEMWALSRR